jgi:hypothetical protein
MTHLTITTEGNVGIGSTAGNKLRVLGSETSSANVMSVSSAYVGSVDVRAVEGFSIPTTGYGIGGYFVGGYRGVQGVAQATGYTGGVVGVDGIASGSSGVRIGVQGSASGGTTNWAGYFTSGNVYVTNELRIGSGAIGGAIGYKVAIDGKLIAEEVRVQLSQNWPDYVFEEDYPLLPLSDVDALIKELGHLPGIPSAAHIESTGLDIGDIQTRMMQKIEELTLYIIQQDKRIQELEHTVSGFRK